MSKLRVKLVMIYALLHNMFFNKSKIVLIVEHKNWIIKEICVSVVSFLNVQHKKIASISLLGAGLKNKIIHFGSVHTLFKKGFINTIHLSNKVIVSWFHIESDDVRLAALDVLSEKVDVLHTSCTITKDTLVSHGFPAQKIQVIPIGIDLSHFKRFSVDKRKKIKRSLELPEDKIIIGSFQKDGNGWGEGFDPKLVKGPDVFCDVVEKVNKTRPVHALLTGPARGYVKKRLETAGISYTHTYLDAYRKIVDYYNCLDVYIIGSRIEGGPKALIESWACHVPVVTTKVGMCADYVEHKKNGLMYEVEDIDGLAQGVLVIVSDKNLQEKITKNGLKDVQQFNWEKIAQEYYTQLYKSFL